MGASKLSKVIWVSITKCYATVMWNVTFIIRVVYFYTKILNVSSLYKLWRFFVKDGMDGYLVNCWLCIYVFFYINTFSYDKEWGAGRIYWWTMGWADWLNLHFDREGREGGVRRHVTLHYIWFCYISFCYSVTLYNFTVIERPGEGKRERYFIFVT